MSHYVVNALFPRLSHELMHNSSTPTGAHKHNSVSTTNTYKTLMSQMLTECFLSELVTKHFHRKRFEKVFRECF